MVHELEETLAPLLPAELPDAFQVLEVQEVIVQATLAFPRQHPHIAPLVPQELGPWGAKLGFGLIAASGLRNNYNGPCTQVTKSDEGNEEGWKR